MADDTKDNGPAEDGTNEGSNFTQENNTVKDPTPTPVEGASDSADLPDGEMLNTGDQSTMPATLPEGATPATPNPTADTGLETTVPMPTDPAYNQTNTSAVAATAGLVGGTIAAAPSTTGLVGGTAAAATPGVQIPGISPPPGAADTTAAGTPAPAPVMSTANNPAPAQGTASTTTPAFDRNDPIPASDVADKEDGDHTLYQEFIDELHEKEKEIHDIFRRAQKKFGQQNEIVTAWEHVTGALGRAARYLGKEVSDI